MSNRILTSGVGGGLDGLLITNQQITKSAGGGLWPHKVDIYIPNGPVTRSLTLLHGGGGTKGYFALQLGILKPVANPDGSISHLDVNWPLLSSLRLMCFVPQGQYIFGVDPAWGPGNNPFNPHDYSSISTQNPNGIPLWDNRAYLSGVDDKSFLIDWGAWANANYPGIGHSLAGHSAGAMMVQKMWFEAPNAFNSHIALCGSPATYYSPPMALPTLKRPIMQIFGGVDTNLGIWGGPYASSPLVSHFLDPVWYSYWSSESDTLVNFPAQRTNIGAWTDLLTRAPAMGETSTPSFAGGTTVPILIGNETTWSLASGKYVLKLRDSAAHDVVSQRKCSGTYFIRDCVTFIGNQH